MGPHEATFDWRGFLFFTKFCTSIMVVGVSLHWGTVYAVHAFFPAAEAAAQELSVPLPTTPTKPDPQALSWQKLPDASWAPRDSAASFVFKDKLWTMGGLNGNGVEVGPDHAVQYWTAPYFNDIWSSEDGTSWIQERAAAEWQPRRSMTVAEFKGKLWMLGGWTPKVGYTSDIWTSKDAVHWSRTVAEAPWPPREGQTLEVWQGKLWLIGGVNYDERKTYNDVWYSSDGTHWTQAPEAPWPSRWDHATAIFNDTLFMAGGMDITQKTYNDVWSTTDGLKWQQVVAEAPWMPRQGHSLVVADDTMYIVGRLNDDTTVGPNDLWYTHDGALWQKTAVDPPWIGREDHSVVLFRDRLLVFGGMDSNWHWQNDVWQSSLVAKPAPPPLPEAPVVSAKAAVVLVGGKAIMSKEAGQELPIASLTKLMTALVASEAFAPTDTIAMSSSTLSGKGLSGIYTVGQTLYVKDALYALLVASHNEAANALADKLGTKAFVAKMNERAASLGLEHTRFSNPSGLDQDEGASNYSTAQDIATLLMYIYEHKPDLFAILGTKTYALVDTTGAPIATLETTDDLLKGAAPAEILGGKTGETPKAGQNLAVVAKLLSGEVVVSVVVGSYDSMGDMRAVLEFAKSATALPLLQ